MSYSELRKQILSLLSRPPYKYNIPYLALYFRVDRTIIHKVIKPLVKRGVIQKEYYDGMSWISLRSKSLYESLKWDVEYHLRKTRIKKDRRVDLIKNKRVSQTVLFSNRKLGKEGLENNHGFPTMDLSSNRMVGNSRELGIPELSTFQQVGKLQQPGISNKIKWPRRAHWTRIQAFRILIRRKQLTLDDWVMLNKLFNTYLDDTGHRTIILLDETEGKTLWMPYRHRFTKSGMKRILRRFNSVFEKANKYVVGVWLTLTVDPKKYRNIIEMRYELQKAWNRFMSWLKKKLGKRPAYLRVIEFTKSGLVHYHILLLGVSRIGDKKTEVTPELERIGFGKVNFMYTVINRNGKWVPKKLVELRQGKAKECLDGAGLPSNLRSYLKKYLMKAFNDLDMDSMSVELNQVNPISLYWALNSRFFTYSKQIRPDPEIHVSFKLIIGDKVLGYRFLGSGYIVNPDVLPLETEKPPWEYFVDYTFPPWYDPTFEL